MSDDSKKNENEVPAPTPAADLGAPLTVTPAITDQQVREYRELNRGAVDALGRYVVPDDAKPDPATGKIKGDAITVAEEITDAHYREHLEGRERLGIILITDSDTCHSVRIDLDEYKDTDWPGLAKRLAKIKFPAYLTLSKSGGVHLTFQFSDEPLAVEARAVARAAVEQFGLKVVEVFPKQDRRGDTGNWINLPYFGNTCWCLDDTGELIPLARYLTFAASKRTTLTELRAQVERRSMASDGPPCLAAYQADRGAKFGGSGMRNETFAHALVYVKHKHGDDFRAEAEKLNRVLFANPLASGEVTTAIKSYTGKEYGYKCDSMKPYCDRTACEKRKFGINALVQLEPWKTPQGLFKMQLLPPPLPRGVLPQVIEDFAFGNPQFHPGALAACAMVACATVLSDAIKVEAINGFTQSARLWYSPTGSPSSRKTPAQRAAFKPLYRIEKEFFKLWLKEYKEWKANDKKDKGDAPVRPRLVTTDITIEKAAEICARTPAGIGWCPEELSSAIYQIEGGRQQASNQRGDWLKTYDGGSHVVDRIGRGEIYVDNFSMSLCSGNTLDKLERNYRDLPADGLMARIGMILTPPPTPNASIEQFKPQVETAYDSLIRALAKHRDMTTPVHIQLTKGALRVFEQFKYDLEIDAAEYEETLPRYAERRGKGLGEALRVACVFQMVERTGELDMQDEVAEDTMARACAWVNWQQTNDRLLYEYLEGNAISVSVALARLVADHLLAHEVQEFQLSAITSGVKMWRDAKPWDRYGALDLLVQLGWIRTRGEYWRGGTFVHGKTFEVNPEAHTVYRGRAERVRRQNAERKAQLEAATVDRRR